MSINKHRQHIIIIPEDDANRAIADAFMDYFNAPRQVQILSENHIGTGGWQKVIDWFCDNKLIEMENTPNRITIFLIDFDGHFSNHIEYVKNKIPDDLQERIFTLGSLTEPENLKSKSGANLGNYETIGEGLAKDCEENTIKFWGHELLKHNFPELQRMRSLVNPIFFGK